MRVLLGAAAVLLSSCAHATPTTSIAPGFSFKVHDDPSLAATRKFVAHLRATQCNPGITFGSYYSQVPAGAATALATIGYDRRSARKVFA